MRVLLLLALHVAVGLGNIVYDPSSAPLTPYGGGAPERRSFGYVNQWPAGIFIAGSSIDEMNGVYVEVKNMGSLPLRSYKAYTEIDTKWTIAVAAAEPDFFNVVGHRENEWVIIDDTGKVRFACEGGSYLPGAGAAWRHVSRPLVNGPFSVGTHVVTREALEGYWPDRHPGRITAVDGPPENPLTFLYTSEEGVATQIRTQLWRLARDASVEHAVATTADPLPETRPSGYGRAEPVDNAAYAELPWQVIALMDPSKVEDMANQKRDHAAAAARARIAAASDAEPAPASDIFRLTQPPPGTAPPPAAALAACSAGQAEEATVALTAAAASADAAGALWGAAVARVTLGACLRRLHRPEAAVAQLLPVAQSFPRYHRALVELALAFLDSGDAPAAVQVLEHAVAKGAAVAGSPAAAAIRRWMVVAHARTRHQGRPFVTSAFQEGQTVRMVGQYAEYWVAGDEAVVKDLGNPSAPILIEVPRTGKRINVQPEYLTAIIPAIDADRATGDQWAAARPGGIYTLTAPKVPASLTGCEAFAAVGDDLYRSLRVAADVAAADLRKAFRVAGRVTHPDAGNACSSRASFELVSTANAVLVDPEKRHSYDIGADLFRPDGARGATLAERVEKRYFPRAGSFHAFGDPRSDRDTADGGRRQREAARANWDAAAKGEEEWRAQLLAVAGGAGAGGDTVLPVGECGAADTSSEASAPGAGSCGHE